MYDIITFGSATRDIFLRTKQFLIGDFKIDHLKKEICLPYGLKIDIQKIHFHSGGGGTNAAATFVAQGLKSAYCGVIGEDPEGKFVHAELLEKGIDTKFILKTSKKPTNVSIIFSTPQERTILVYKGASQLLERKMIPWPQIKNTRWFYLAALSGKSASRFGGLVHFAKKNNIKVMANPGNSQLKMPLNSLKPILKKIDILLLNQDEGRMLARTPFLQGEKLVKEIKKIFPGILILTNGERKIFVNDGEHLFTALPLGSKAMDKTGAGDAFGSGFLAGYIKSCGNTEKAIQMAVANAFSCIQKWGAKEGILSKNQPFKKVKVSESQPR